MASKLKNWNLYCPNCNQNVGLQIDETTNTNSFPNSAKIIIILGLLFFIIPGVIAFIFFGENILHMM